MKNTILENEEELKNLFEKAIESKKKGLKRLSYIFDMLFVFFKRKECITGQKIMDAEPVSIYGCFYKTLGSNLKLKDKTNKLYSCLIEYSNSEDYNDDFKTFVKPKKEIQYY